MLRKILTCLLSSEVIVIVLFTSLRLKDKLGLCSINGDVHSMTGNCSASLWVLAIAFALSCFCDDKKSALSLTSIWSQCNGGIMWSSQSLAYCDSRSVLDYRGLNTVTAGDGYPIPSVSNVLDALSGGKKFAKLDLASGYWQVLVNPEHVHKTAFATHLGLYEFLRMPYGLRTAPQTFQRILNSVFADFLYQWLIICIDDVIVWANTNHEALSRYELVFERAAKFGIQFKPTKCVFFSQDLEILGHRVTPLGRFPTSKGTEAISAVMCLVSNVFLAWLTTLGIMSETWLLVQNIFVHFCARGTLLFGPMLMKQNFVISKMLWYLQIQCIIQTGIVLLSFILMLASMVLEQCLPNGMKVLYAQLNLLLVLLLQLKVVGQLLIKSFLP